MIYYELVKANAIPGYTYIKLYNGDGYLGHVDKYGPSYFLSNTSNNPYKCIIDALMPLPFEWLLEFTQFGDEEPRSSFNLHNRAKNSWILVTIIDELIQMKYPNQKYNTNININDPNSIDKVVAIIKPFLR